MESRTSGFFTAEAEKADVCRLCMMNSERYLSIFLSNETYAMSIGNAIQDVLHLEVAVGDGLPGTVCFQCVRKLMEFHEFKDMCYNSARELKRRIQSETISCPPVKIEPFAQSEEGEGSSWDNSFQGGPQVSAESKDESDPLAVGNVLTQVTDGKRDRKTVSIDEMLIELVQPRDCLYKKSSNAYKDEKLKERHWADIASIISEVSGEEKTADDMRKRWISLREQFNRAHRKKLGQLPPGSGNKSDWPLYRQMLFVAEHIRHRQLRSLYRKSAGGSVGCIPADSSLRRDHGSSGGSGCMSAGEVECVLSDDCDRTVQSPEPVSAGDPCGSSSRDRGMVKKRTLSNASPPDAKKTRDSEDCLREIGENVKIAASALVTIVNRKEEFRKKEEEKDTDPFISTIDGRLRHVPSRWKTPCYIEILQVIEKYEVHDG